MSDITPQAPQGPLQAFPGEIPTGLPGQEPETYQALSVFALLGFCLAVLASGLLLLGGLVPLHRNWTALFYVSLLLAPLIALGFGGALRGERKPEVMAGQAGLGVVVWAAVMGIIGLITNAAVDFWDLGLYFWVPVVAALCLSLLGWLFILNSEGTVTGEWYARWGVFLSLFFSMIYVAYLYGISTAVAAQARAQAREFFDDLKKGDTLAAFTLTTRAAARARDPRAQAEADNALSGGANPGVYTTLCTSELARLLAVAGDEATVTETRYTELKAPRPGQSSVRLEYHIQTPFHDIEVRLDLASEEVTVAKVRQRSWHVVYRHGPNVPDEAISPKVTAITSTRNWRPYAEAAGKASERIRPFLQGLGQGKRKAELAKLMDFSEAWTFDPAHRQAVQSALADMVAGKPSRVRFEMLSGQQGLAYPLFELSPDGKKATMKFDVRVEVVGPDGNPAYVAEGQVFVEGPFGGAEGDYKVTKLKWERARKVEPRQPPGGGRGPG